MSGDPGVDPTLGVVAGWAGSSDLMAAAHGATGWTLLQRIVPPGSLVFVGDYSFAAGPGTGVWGFWDFGSTYLRAERYNQ